MSLLMQALRKAERARAHNGGDHPAEHHPGQDTALSSPPPLDGGPAFAVMPDAWRLEPLDAEPPVVAAQEAVHDPVPPQARHEPPGATPSRNGTFSTGGVQSQESERAAGGPLGDAAFGPETAQDLAGWSASDRGAIGQSALADGAIGHSGGDRSGDDRSSIAYASGDRDGEGRGTSGYGASVRGGEGRTAGYGASDRGGNERSAGDRSTISYGASERSGVRNPGARPPAPPRAIASSQRRVVVLTGTLAALLAVFAFIYWRAVSGPGPGARLPMVPMPAPGALPPAPAGGPQTAIPVSPYVTPAGSEAAAPGTGATTAPLPAPGGAGTPAPPAGAVATGAPGSAAPMLADAGTPPAAPASAAAPRTSAAPASKPRTDVTIPTPEQLAAIPDPAIRAEAMRDAAERAARQVRMEGASPSGAASGGGPAPREEPAPATAPAKVAATSTEPGQIPGQMSIRRSRTRQPVEARAGGPPTAVGENGDVRFVRSTDTLQVAPAVQHGYQALQAGDLATARQQYDLALLQEPNNRDALLGSAAVALREHDGKQASANYLRLLELDPNDPEALAALAELHPGDLQASETRLRGLARQHPESGPVQFALGNLYARQGRWPEAQQSYFRAFTAMPGNADYAFNLGVGLDRMNQPRLAANYYRRAMELAQASPPGFNIDAVRKRMQALETPAH